jgi:replicative DNA helicase
MSHFRTAVKEYDQYLDKLKERQYQVGLPTGLTTYDRLTGGLKASELIILAGSTSAGKTALAMQITFNIADYLRSQGDDSPIVVFSGEMPKYQLVAREIARQTGVPIIRQFQGEFDELERQDIERVKADLADLSIFITDKPGLDTNHVKRVLSNFQAPAMVVVDHLQLAAKRGVPPYQAVTDAIETLRELRGEKECPFLVLSQFSRDKSEVPQRPVLNRLRDSGKIEEAASVALLLHNPAALDRSTELDGPAPAELIVAKNRDGWTGHLNLIFKPEQLSFEEKTNE